MPDAVGCCGLCLERYAPVTNPVDLHQHMLLFYQDHGRDIPRLEMQKGYDNMIVLAKAVIELFEKAQEL